MLRGASLEKDPNAAKQFTPLIATDANNFVELCKKNQGSVFLRVLMEKDPNAAKQFTPLAADANIHDTIAGKDIFYQTFKKYPSIKGFSADQGYRGTSFNFVTECLKIKADIPRKMPNQFKI